MPGHSRAGPSAVFDLVLEAGVSCGLTAFATFLNSKPPIDFGAPMKWICLASLLCVPALFAGQVDVAIGPTTITVPVPAGFAPVTADMTNTVQALSSTIGEQNQALAWFIPAELVAAAKSGNAPAPLRTLSVQTAKATMNRSITAADMAELEQIIVEQNAELAKRLELQFPGIAVQVRESVAGKLNAKLRLELQGIFPLEPHVRTNRMLAYSSFVKYAMRDPGTGLTNSISAVVTATLVHARAKLFFLYANGGEQDLDWTRQISRNWAEAILAANPSDATAAAAETAGPSGFDWKRIQRGALIGGVIGGLVGLVGYFFARGKRT